jgi:hypothetical protein
MGIVKYDLGTASAYDSPPTANLFKSFIKVIGKRLKRKGHYYLFQS